MYNSTFSLREMVPRVYLHKYMEEGHKRPNERGNDQY